MDTANVDQMLEEMAQAGRAQVASAQDWEGVGVEPTRFNPGRPEIARVRYTHDAMIDLIIQEPGIHQNELAKVFGFSATWISVVINSDAFQAKLALRKDELIDPELRASIKERFQAVVVRSTQVLLEKLNKPVDQISDQLALRAAEMGAKALGLGGNAPAQTVVISSEDRLQKLAGRLTGLMGSPSPAVDVEVREVNS